MSVVRHPTDRRCPHVDEETGVRCITRLCRMNPGPECFAHATPVRPPTVGEQEAAARREFDRLMTQHEGRIAA